VLAWDPPSTRTGREYPGPVTALANPGDDADQPAAETPAANARTVRLASPSLQGVVRFVLIVVACGIALFLAWRAREVIRLVGISVFFALTLMPVIDATCSKTRAPRALVILAVYVLLIAAVALVGYVVAPSLVKEVQQLSHNAPQYATELRRNSTFRHYDNRYHISTKLVHDARGLPHLLGHLVGPLKDVTVQAFSFIGQLITVLAIAFLLVLHGREYVNMGLSLTGEREQGYRQLIIDINKAVASCMLGNIIISGLATLATWIVLSILGVTPRAVAWLRRRLLRPDSARRSHARRDRGVVRDSDGGLPDGDDRLDRVHHRLAAVRGLRRAAARLREGAAGQPDRDDRLRPRRRFAAWDPRRAARHTHRRGDPDRAARLVGTSQG
jgi:hypothetical protein